MQIAASTLSLSSRSLSYRSQETRQHLEMRVGDRPRPAAGAAPAPARTPPLDDSLFRSLQQSARSRGAGNDPPADDAVLDPAVDRVLLILEKLFGMKGIRRAVLKLQPGQAAAVQAQQPPAGAEDAPGQARAGWGLTYDETVRTVTAQSASLAAEGSLTLADGSQLAFHLDWSQSSLQVQESSTHLALGDAARPKDPLVLDLDGNGIAFAGTMPLALGGGAPATVARPAGADAILVRDGDGDGKVGDGEVVGAATGQAFAELASYDDDGNGWIDAGDAVWKQLRLLDGSGTLRAVDGAVAAIATASVALPYQHRDGDGGLQAVGRRGGVAVGADGTARAVAQVDLVA